MLQINAWFFTNARTVLGCVLRYKWTETEIESRDHLTLKMLLYSPIFFSCSKCSVQFSLVHNGKITSDIKDGKNAISSGMDSLYLFLTTEI